jgi:hypothetical protein
MRFLMQQYPAFTWRVNVRLGKVKEEVTAGIPKKYAAMSRLYGLTADAIVFLPDKIIIIEALIRPGEWWKIEQLQTYERAFKVTEEFRKYWDFPVEKILLTTETDAFMESEAARRGIRVVKFTTPDIEAYKGTIQKRKAQPFGTGLESI